MGEPLDGATCERPQDPVFEERRRWERYASILDQLTLITDVDRRTVAVVDASPDGMGLSAANSLGLSVGQLVTLDGPAGPAPAVIRFLATQQEGTARIGIEWSN
ncbi:MAG: hypothetical protein ACC645_08645 [Pirellulales bacterium]